MAMTFTSYNSGISFAASKVMGGIYNRHASEILKIRRVGLLNGQTAAVTGVLCNLEMRLTTGTPTWTTPVAGVLTSHDSTNTAPTTYDQGNSGTFSGGTSTALRRTNWSSDEAAVSAATMDELECFVPLNIIFDAGYGDTNVQPLTLNQNQMAHVFNVSGAAGLLDVWLEFTKE
jgi:hypothetical protein